MKLSRRTFLLGGGAVALGTTLGCGKGFQPLEMYYPWLWGQPNHPGPHLTPEGGSVDLISHVLNRLSFGPRPWDYARVKRMAGSEQEAAHAYIEEQLAPETLDDSHAERTFRRFETLAEPAGELYEYKGEFLLEHLTRATFLRAVLSERQLFEVMAGFWTDHFNIAPSKGDCKWLKVADDRDVIRSHALGNWPGATVTRRIMNQATFGKASSPHPLGRFPDMVRASALSPAMLWYLDGRENKKARKGEHPNENYARELLELHTLGVHGGYTQRDVMEAARCLTGWTVHPSGYKWNFMHHGEVVFNPKNHDDGEKVVLGQRIPAGGGTGDLDALLDIITLHPATARHIATKLCRRFISEEPSEGVVQSVAAEFLRTKGDIRDMLRVLFGSAEFREARGEKFKRPFHFMVSALRAVNGRSNASRELLDFLTRMGHAPFQYPTPDGYPEEAAPWMGTLLWRWNFATALVENRITGTQVNLERLMTDVGGDNGLMAHTLGRAATRIESEAYRDSGAGLALLLASPGFQKC